MQDPQDIRLEEERRCYRGGIALFNAGQFFEAHEVWENAWRGSSGSRREFYQGLIQMAVALLHLQRGNPRGATKTLDRALARWAELPDVYMGLHLRSFAEQVRRMVVAANELRTSPTPSWQPSRAPTIRLEYAAFEESPDAAGD